MALSSSRFCFYTISGDIIGGMRVGDPTSSYYLTDNEGSVVDLVGSNGAVVASYFYCPTGNLAEPGSGQYAFTNPYRKWGAFYDWRFLTYWINGLQVDANSLNARQLAYWAVSPHGYEFLWNLGAASILGSATHAMAFFQVNPRLVFPFPLGSCSAVIRGETCDIRPIPGLPSYPTPVEVTNVSPTSFTFASLPGHFDPVGSTIAFLTGQVGGSLYLSQIAHWAPGGNALFELGSVPVALAEWGQQAFNLSTWLQIVGSG